MILNREIHRLLRYMQVKYRRVRKASEFNLAIAEIHVLVELDAAGELSVNELTDSLRITQSQVSRILQKLRARHLISQRSGKSDNRRVISSLTREGRQMITRIDSVMGDIFNSSAQSLNPKEQRELATFFEKVARAHGCSIIRRRTGESQLRACHRQMARIFGLLGNSVYGSTLTRAQWSILETLIGAREPVSAQILEGFLGIRSALISEILTSFEAHGYIDRTRSLENHRINLLHPTTSGRRLFRRLETQAVVKLKKSLGTTSLKELHYLHQLLTRFTGAWGQDSIYLSQSLTTRQIEDAQERRAARAFALREVVRRGWELDIPDPLLPSDCQIWGLYDRAGTSDTLKALCVSAAGKFEWNVRFGVWNESLSQTQFNAFIQYAHYLSYSGKAAPQLIVSFIPLSP